MFDNGRIKLAVARDSNGAVQELMVSTLSGKRYSINWKAVLQYSQFIYVPGVSEERVLVYMIDDKKIVLDCTYDELANLLWKW